MAWYHGTVVEAIGESKRSSKLFVVYVAGKSLIFVFHSGHSSFIRKCKFN